MQLPASISIPLLLLISISGETWAVQRQATEAAAAVTVAHLAISPLDQAPRSSLNPPHLDDDFPHVRCDNEGKLGVFDTSLDCSSALAGIPSGTRIITWAERDNPHTRPWMYPLPWRWMGGNVP